MVIALMQCKEILALVSAERFRVLSSSALLRRKNNGHFSGSFSLGLLLCLRRFFGTPSGRTDYRAKIMAVFLKGVAVDDHCIDTMQRITSGP